MPDCHNSWLDSFGINDSAATVVRLLIHIFLSTALASAEIDSGGGRTTIGTMTNHSSIGAIVASETTVSGPERNHTGLIEILYAEVLNPDSNGNGLPDDWEQEYFQDQTVNPEEDSDGDGVSNRGEYTAGTNPTDRGSVFAPRGSFQGAVFSMPMQTVAGRIYKVYATKDLANWYLQETITGNGEQHTFTFDETAVTSGPLHSSTHPSSYFFRIEVSLP